MRLAMSATSNHTSHRKKLKKIVNEILACPLGHSIEGIVNEILRLNFQNNDQPPVASPTTHLDDNCRIKFQQYLPEISTLYLDPYSLLFETMLSDQQLKYSGIVHTPPWLARMMVLLSLNGKEQRILDPACGTGVFLEEILNTHLFKNGQLIGIEKSRLATTIARMRLKTAIKRNDTHEMMDIASRVTLKIHAQDFFQYLQENKREIVGRVDLIIGNPPYVRQELLKNKTILNKAIQELCDFSFDIDKKSDLYVYFIITGMQILSEQGKLCLIIPDKWLNARYGISLKKIILAKSMKVSLFLLNRDTFPNTDVRPLILLVEKLPKGKINKNNKVTIIDLTNPLHVKKIIKQLSVKKLPDEKIFTSIIKSQKQKIIKEQLQKHENWAMIIHAPNFFQKILQHPRTIPLHNKVFSRVEYGNKTGANEFFFLSDDLVKQLDIPKQFLKPAIKSVKGIQGITLKRGDSWLLHVPREMDNNSLEKFPSLISYIEWGMKTPRRFQCRPSCYKPRNPPHLHKQCKHCSISHFKEICKKCRWFSLTLKDPPDFLLAKVNHLNLSPIYNEMKAYPSDSIQCIHVTHPEHRDFLHSCLLSTINALSMELMGRREGGGALTLMIRDTRRLPILNPLKLKPTEYQTIGNSMKTLTRAREQKRDFEEITYLQDHLDLQILKAWGCKPDTLKKVKKTLNRLQKKRLEKARLY